MPGTLLNAQKVDAQGDVVQTYNAGTPAPEFVTY